MYAAIAVNIALALLPIYDSSNIRCWISLGSSITSSAPAMVSNPWPGGFFSFMVFTPMYLTYLYSGFNLYASVVVLKLILFFFTLLTAALLYRITQKVKPAYAYAVLLFTLLNPAILYIDYFWAQIDMLPVFFFTLGFALLRYGDFGGSNFKRYLISFFPIIISAFIYRYSLILVPALVLYDSGGLRQKVSAFAVALGEAGALFAAEFVFFRGGLYNYVGALSGSVINMSGVEGFQYWVSIPQLPYIFFLGALGIAVPALFRALRYREPAALFFILLLFIYTSTVPLPDYFLWLYPLGIFLAITSTSKLSFNKKLLITSLPVYVGLFFISFIIGNGVQAGPFYFAYPLLHQNIAFVSSAQEYNLWVLIFNVFLLGSVLATSLFCLRRSNREETTHASPESLPVRLWKMKRTFAAKKKVVMAAAIVLMVLLSFSFNALYSQPIVASSEQVFPLYFFPSVNNYDASPLDSTYYLSWAGLVVYNNWSEPIAFNHALNQQEANLNLTFSVQTDRYATFKLLKTDNYSMGLTIQPHVLTANMSVMEPASFSGPFPQKINVPIIEGDAAVYKTGLSSYVSYRFDSSAISKYYVTAFKFTNDSLPQSMFLRFRNNYCILEYSVSNSQASIYYRDFAANKSSYFFTNYNSLSADGWNLLVFAPTPTIFYSWVNNKPLHVQGSFFRADTVLTVGSAFSSGDSGRMGGYVTQLYCGASAPAMHIERYFFIRDNLGNTMSTPLNSSELNVSLLATPQYSKVQIGDSSFTLDGASAFAFGKLTAGDYGLAMRLNHLELSQRETGYYLVPVFLAVAVPFAVAVLCLPLLFKRDGEWAFRFL